MDQIGIITLCLIIANGLVTFQGLQDYGIFRRFSFNIGAILSDRDYKRLVTSGFLHVNWSHFFFNMFTLYIFSDALEMYLGKSFFLILYFASLVGGNLLALFIHRNNPLYTAIGASGAVSGLVFASIGLFPGMELGFILLPFYFPAWAYGIGYVLYSIYGIRSQRDNIGHEAHLGGGITGLLIAIIMAPQIILSNYFPVMMVLAPALAFLYLTLSKRI